VNILFVSGNPHLPQVIGGVEINTHKLATELVRRGHNAAVAAKLSLRNRFGLKRAFHAAIARQRISRDDDLGYTVFRSRRPWEVVTELPRLDVAVIQNGQMLEFGRAFARIDVPTVAYFHGLAFESWTELQQPSLEGLPFRGYLAVSRFVARRFEGLCGTAPVVVPPFFRREDYATRPTGTAVTFINPVPVKGLHLALQIAALCPTIPFCFVCAWPLRLSDWAMLRRRLGRIPNVELRNRTYDMRTIYRDTKILLVPSPLETWGRVASEAQFSGIPVVASDCGGLPEAVGPGGIILQYDRSPAVWAAVIRQLWSDATLYRQLSDAALHHSARPSLDPDRQLASLLEALSRCVGPCATSTTRAI
jgi:glycosyltransferase involved in cell wall biosynthesis